MTNSQSTFVDISTLVRTNQLSEVGISCRALAELGLFDSVIDTLFSFQTYLKWLKDNNRGVPEFFIVDKDNPKALDFLIPSLAYVRHWVLIIEGEDSNYQGSISNLIADNLFWLTGALHDLKVESNDYVGSGAMVIDDPLSMN